MQQPPPGPSDPNQPAAPMQPPPASGPPPAYAGGGAVASTNKKTFSILAYLLGWVTGIIFLFVGKDDPDVKINAAQSIVWFGGLTVLRIIVGIVFAIIYIPFLGGLINIAIGIFGLVTWIMLLMRVNSAQGARVELPFMHSTLAPFAEQIAGAVN